MSTLTSDSKSASHPPQAGDIWKEVDPRAERYVRVISLSTPSGKYAFIRTCDANGVSGTRNPVREARVERFNGKRGGYELWARDHRTSST